MRDLADPADAHAAPAAGRTSPAGTRLLVFPHAGGGSGYYRGWADWLPATVDLEVVDLPGHSTRMREPLITDWHRLVADLAAVVRRRAGGGYVLAGHSLGALLAFEVARTMEADGIAPDLLIVSGRNAPAAGLSHRPIHRLPDAAFLEALERLGGTAGPVLAQPDLMRVYLPLLRTGLRLAETYTRAPGPPLSAPVAAFAGRQDRLTEGSGLIGWSRETTGTFDLTMVEGGHFFHGHPGFAAAVRARLDRLGPRPTRTETRHTQTLAPGYSALVDFIR